jgi:cell division protein FtsB
MQINPDQLMGEVALMAIELRMKDRHLEQLEQENAQLQKRIADLSQPVIPDPPEGGADADDPGRATDS